MVQSLVEEIGVDVLARDKNGATALDKAKRTALSVERLGLGVLQDEDDVVAYLTPKIAEKVHQGQRRSRTTCSAHSPFLICISFIHQAAAAEEALLAELEEEDQKKEAQAKKKQDKKKNKKMKEKEKAAAKEEVVGEASSKEETATTAEPAAEEEDAMYEKAPDNYECPISFVLLTDPVVAMDGYTYQRAALQQWIDKAEESKRLTCMHTSPFFLCFGQPV